MTKRMLIDATHPEETRVVVISGNRLDELDFETSTKQQLKGNIYLAKVTRVEPSLQAAFVEYGGSRHGFLAFNEIHQDYYRIPVGDRQAAETEHPRPETRGRRGQRRDDRERASSAEAQDHEVPPLPTALEGPEGAAAEPAGPVPLIEPAPPMDGPDVLAERPYFDAAVDSPLPESPPSGGAPIAPFEPAYPADEHAPAAGATPLSEPGDGATEARGSEAASEPPVVLEQLGGDQSEDEIDDEAGRRDRQRHARHYKIQEVVKRRQVLLVQVVKEERGGKGAALTTYISLAGRYCVLMPNTDRGGGISRRITNQQDRKRLKSIMDELQVPDGMAVILRTAGMERSIEEIRRDYEYLLRLWDDIRELTLRSTAPTLVYEEGNIIKRAMRDMYSPDIEEVLVEGPDAFRAARDLMHTLTPGHVDRIKLYEDRTVPLFQRYQIEGQLGEIHNPSVRLPSGGYIVINPTEALVSIDVNSGRATRERHIEETAYRTNLEAADEIARQLRLRDLAGLIVIDFIDMEDQRHQQAVERRLKDAMKSDRARIQIGRISPFGLLELSRQRLRPSLAEVSTERCPHCGGTGHIRSTESTALHVLRGIEEEGVKARAAELAVHVPTPVALYILNQKRKALASIETRYALTVSFQRDDALIPPAYKIERARTRPSEIEAAPQPVRTPSREIPPPAIVESAVATALPAIDREAEPTREREPEPEIEAGGEEGGGRGRRRRRRRRGGRGGAAEGQAPMREQAEMALPQPVATPVEPTPLPAEAAAAPEGEALPAAEAGEESRADGERRRRRRGRRGGRRRERGGEGQPRVDDASGTAPPEPEAFDVAGMEVISRPSGPGAGEYRVPSATPSATPSEHDWPWNRQTWTEPARMVPETEPVAPAPPRPRPVAAELVPPPASEPPAAPAAAPVRAEPEPTPPEPEPKGPPRKGWWKRLTSG